MLIKKIILSASVTCLILSPILILTITPITAPISVADYALNFAGGPGIGWYGHDKFEELTYFSFYTFFKSGIDPDCIDIDESKEELT